MSTVTRNHTSAILYGGAGLAVGVVGASVAYYGLHNERANQIRIDHIPRYADKSTMLKVRIIPLWNAKSD